MLGYRFSKLALSFLGSEAEMELSCHVNGVLYIFVIHWYCPMGVGLEPLLHFSCIGTEYGETESAFANAFGYFLIAFLCGETLRDLEKAASKFCKRMKNRINLPFLCNFVKQCKN